MEDKTKSNGALPKKTQMNYNKLTKEKLIEKLKDQEKKLSEVQSLTDKVKSLNSKLRTKSKEIKDLKTNSAVCEECDKVKAELADLKTKYSKEKAIMSFEFTARENNLIKEKSKVVDECNGTIDKLSTAVEEIEHLKTLLEVQNNDCCFSSTNILEYVPLWLESVKKLKGSKVSITSYIVFMTCLSLVLFLISLGIASVFNNSAIVLIILNFLFSAGVMFTGFKLVKVIKT